jgi:hypothetical protein
LIEKRNGIHTDSGFIANASQTKNELNELQMEEFFTEINSIKPPRTQEQITDCNKYQKQIKELMNEFGDIIRDELPDELPPRRIFDPTLELKPGIELKNRPVYRLS